VLAKKFLLYFLAPLVLFTIGSGTLFYWAASSRLQVQVDRNLLATTTAIDLEISNRCQDVRDDLRVIATNPAFAQYARTKRMIANQRVLSDEADRLLQGLEEDFIGVASLEPSVRSIRLLDASGTSIAAMVNGMRSNEAYNALGTEWFERARERAPGDQRIEASLLAENGMVCATFARSLEIKDAPRLVLAIEVEIVPLLSNLIQNRTVGENGYVYLISPSGKILLHSDAGLIGTDVSEYYATKQAQAGYLGLTSDRDASGTTRMRTGFMPLTDVDLGLVVSLPADEALAPMRYIRNLALPLIVLGLLAFAWIGSQMIRQVIQPVRRLTEVTARISAGDLDAHCDVKTGDEIEALADSVNRMTRSLRSSQEKIRAKNRALHNTAEALRKSEQYLNVTLDSIGDGVLATDEKGCVRGINPVGQMLTGYSLEEARGLPLSQIFRSMDVNTRVELEGPFERVLGKLDTAEHPHRTLLLDREGNERQIASSAAPIRTKSGETVGVVIVFRDVTEQQHMETLLQQSQKMESVGRLAGGVAHDFNNLLAVIQGNADLMLSDLDGKEGAEEFREMAQAIVKASRHGAELTSQLLAFSRSSTLHPSRVDLHEVIHEVVSMSTRTFDKRIRVHTDLRATAPTTLGEASMLQNALLNLAINARDAMPDGGTLTFTTENVELDAAACRQLSGDLSPGAHVRISVEDQGIGMTPAILERIFDPFFTTKSELEGTGLGLPAVYGTVVSHGGTIEVSSTPGQGSRFEIHLPVAAGTVEDSTEGEFDVCAGTGHIMVVDDEPAVLKSTAKMLTRLGYIAWMARDGADALQQFEADPALYDLILIDMIMPGMNGRELLERLLAIDPYAHVVLISGFSEGKEVEDALQRGAIGLLRKPYGLNELAASVSKALKIDAVEHPPRS